MRYVILLLLCYGSVLPAAVFKCKDNRGNISYSSSNCRYRDKTGSELKVNADSPHVSKAEKNMRKREKKIMRELLSEYRSNETKLNKRRNKMLAQEQEAKRVYAYKRYKRNYHEAKIDALERKKKTSRTFKAKRTLEKSIKKQQQLKKQYD